MLGKILNKPYVDYTHNVQFHKWLIQEMIQLLSTQGVQVPPEVNHIDHFLYLDYENALKHEGLTK